MKSVPEPLGRALLLLCLALSALGLLMVASSSAVMTASSSAFNQDPNFFVKRQGLFFLIGLGALYLARRMDLQRWRSWLSLPLMGVTVLALVGVLFFGVEINGARRWFLVGPFQIQVAEFAKLAVIFFLADRLARHQDRLDSFWRCVPILLGVGLVAVLVEREPDLGTALSISATIAVMLYAAGVRLLYLWWGAILLASLVVFKILEKPYRIQRMMVFWDPFQDTQGAGYQIYNSLLAVASGGVWGRGIPNSHQKYNYLPEQHTDFIFAIYAEELGLVGSAALVILFTLFGYLGLRIASSCRRPYVSLLAVGLTCQVVFQAFVNIAVVTGAVPTTGITLPFISYGGSSLLVTMVSVGLLLNLADSVHHQRVAAQDRSRERRRLRRGSTLSSSERNQLGGRGSGIWDPAVAALSFRRGPGGLPQPPVEPSLARRLPFGPSARGDRERARRRVHRAGGRPR